MRRTTPKNDALADQIVAILRDANGFPMSTGEVAAKMGDRLQVWPRHFPPVPRPPCWPDDVESAGEGSSFCHRCDRQHDQPVWRNYNGQDIRGLLNRLARTGEVEKMVLSGVRNHYWRREDTDMERGADQKGRESDG